MSHWNQYPPETQKIFSYLESRGGKYNRVMFFGLQYYLLEYLRNQITIEDIEEAKHFFMKHFGKNLMDEAMWRHVVQDHNGQLPVEIKAAPEGMMLPTGCVMMTIVNTCNRCFPVTNYLETLLSKIWYPCTIATRSKKIQSTILKYLTDTGTPDSLLFKLHDFGYRGSTSEESAAIGGAAHLINFFGTDTLAACKLIKDYYGEGMAGFSIPAAEHSTITSWNREEKAYENIVTCNPEGLVAIVSDSYNIMNAIDMWSKSPLKEKLVNRQGTVVIRPDSGDPTAGVMMVLTRLQHHFGATANDKGYLVLPPYVRVIQGDGINEDTVEKILKTMKSYGWSADNIAFGSGGGLLQANTDRDTCQFAIKCSAIQQNGEWHPVVKNPVTASEKKSKGGILTLQRLAGGELFTKQSETLENQNNVLQTVYKNGTIAILQSFNQIRTRASDQ
jgi:nicotinamide phosphoribosyltransferase